MTPGTWKVIGPVVLGGGSEGVPTLSAGPWAVGSARLVSTTPELLVNWPAIANLARITKGAWLSAFANERKTKPAVAASLTFIAGVSDGQYSTAKNQLTLPGVPSLKARVTKFDERTGHRGEGVYVTEVMLPTLDLVVGVTVLPLTVNTTELTF